jgi:hypothetical protein
MTTRFILILSLTALAACNPKVSVDGGSGPVQKTETDYRAENATGMMSGASWTFVSGSARPDQVDAGRMNLNLSNQDFADPCSYASMGKASVLTSVPSAVGEVVFGEGNPIQTATLSYQDEHTGSMNLFVTEGRLKITEVTADHVSGAVIANYDGSNYVNGSFQLKVCPR